ncbi:MAG TPA: TonB family protein [Pyrinomonadaceae bacterium]|jgi:TonB family protein
MQHSRKLFLAFLVAALAASALRVEANAASAQQPPRQPAPSATATTAPPSNTVRGVELYRQGNYKEAIKLLRDVVKQHKEDANAWLYLGMAYIKTNEMKKAREALQTARRLRPQDETTLNALTVVLLQGGDALGAMQVALEAVKHAPSNFEAHYLLAAISYRIGRFAQALEGAEKTLKLKPDFPAALYLKGQALLGLSDQAQTNSRNETPELSTVLAEKSAARFAEGMQTLETFMRLAPDAPEVPQLREDLKQMRLFREALDPSNPNRTIFAAREVTTRALIQSKPEPLYTERAKQNQVTGTVRLRLVLGADGKVQHIYPVRRLPDGLTEACINAARKIKFIPAMKDGRFVSQYVTIEYNFNIY